MQEGLRKEHPKGKGSTVPRDEHRTSSQKSEFESYTPLLYKLEPVIPPHFTEEGIEALRDL